MQTKMVIFFLSIICLATSCAPAYVGGAGVTALGAAQERRIGSAAEDSAIWAKIKNAYFQYDVDRIFTPIDVKVTEGRVLLNGTVTDNDAKLEAIRLAWSVKGVKEVINEIRVKKGHNFDIKQYAQDSFITSQIRGKLLIEKNLRSINYTLDTIDGVVYILGIAQSESELAIVTDIARSVQGVKNVKNYARTKDHNLRNEGK